jgi:hypothetical protein
MSLLAVASALPVAGSNGCTPGQVSDRMCMSVPSVSISLNRPSPMS